MLTIAVCDDNAEERAMIAENLRIYQETQKGHGIESRFYSSGFELLEAFEKTGCPDLALLDICMPDMLGTDLARDILRCSQNTEIIFLTTSADYAMEAFSLHAADYICKPYNQEKFNTALDRVIARYKEKTWILLPCQNAVYRIAAEDILYIETRDKQRIVFLTSGRRLVVGLSAAQLQALLSRAKGMVMCGASFMVNLNHVRCFSGTDLVMDEGTLIPIPRRCRTQMKQAYFDFYLKEAEN